MNLESIQEYFKIQIEIGNFTILNIIRSNDLNDNTWVSMLVENRPFVIKTNETETIQDGDISENYIQLGNFTQKQHKTIYEREKKRRFVRNDKN